MTIGNGVSCDASIHGGKGGIMAKITTDVIRRGHDRDSLGAAGEDINMEYQ